LAAALGTNAEADSNNSNGHLLIPDSSNIARDSFVVFHANSKVTVIARDVRLFGTGANYRSVTENCMIIHGAEIRCWYFLFVTDSFVLTLTKRGLK
jgi:hypothetical protein